MMGENRRRRNLESSILIWLTANPIPTTLDRLRKTIDYVEMLNTPDACTEYIEQVEDDAQIYVFTEMPFVSNKAQVYFHETKGNDENMDTVIQAIQTDHDAQLNPFGMNIFKQSTHSQLNSEFLWFQRVLGVLIDTDDREKAKLNFIEMYKRYYNGNRLKEAKIEEFKNTYQSENALQWYTRECFFFDVLNKALRIQDIDVLFSLRFFLKDMLDQLQARYKKVSHDIDMTVYRGQTISAEELQLIKENVGHLISLNSFISATSESEVAMGFSMSGDPSGKHIVFHIKVDKSVKNSKPFADISAISQFTHEREVLFMAGSIFEIKNIHFNESFGMWIIELNLCDDNVYELNDVYETDRTVVSNEKSPFSLAAVLLRMNMHEKAQKYYQQLLDEGSMNDISNTELITNCYWGLSNVYRKKGDPDIALAYSRLAIEQCQDQPDLLLRSYKYISFNYLDIHLDEEALEYQMKTLQIQQTMNADQDQIADTLYNIGAIYCASLKSNDSHGLDYFVQALKIYESLNKYDDIIRCYHAIGDIHLRRKDKQLALNYHLKAFELVNAYYSSYLPSRILAFEYLANTYKSMRNYEQAITCYNEALNAKLKYEPLSDPNIADSYEAFGSLYHTKGDCAKAIEMYDKAIEIRRRTQPESHPDIESLVSLRNCLQDTIE